MAVVVPLGQGTMPEQRAEVIEHVRVAEYPPVDGESGSLEISEVGAVGMPAADLLASTGAHCLQRRRINN